MPLSTEEIDAIALAVYRRLVGGSVGVLAGPTSGDPLDVPHTADFEYTFDADVAADSSLVFTIRRDVADVDAVLEIVDDELVTVDGDDAEFPTDAEVERLSATSCRVTIRARSLQLVDPGVYVAEFRELTVSSETVSKHEVGLAVRRSPSRRIAE